MKRKVGIFSAIAFTGAALMAIVLSSVGINGHLFSFRSEADQSYTLTLNNSNKYDGAATKTIYTDNNHWSVQFSYSGCAINAGGHVTLNANGTLKNDQQITSITSLYPIFTTLNNATLKFRASFNGTKWGEYSTLTSEKAFDLSASQPYFIELKAEGGSVNLTSLRYSYSCVANPNTGTGEEEWQLVTNKSDLAVNDKVVIVASDYSYALSTTQNSNNRGITNVTKDSDAKTVAINGNVQQLTLTDTSTISSGSFGLYTGSGYLYAASSTANNLRTQTDNNANGAWSIDITSAGIATIIAQGSNSRNELKYNSSSSIFSCYGEGNTQKDVSIYKKSIGVNTPAYETGLDVSDAKAEVYTVSQTFDSFVENGGLTVSALMSDGSSKKLAKSDYSYSLTHLGFEQDPTQNFAHAGEHTVTITYKGLIPVVYTINVANVVTGITASKTTTSYHVGDAIVLTDISAILNYQVDGSSSSIAYNQFGAKGLSCELINPSKDAVSSDTFNDEGNWIAKVYLTANSSIYDEIIISVTSIPVSSISLNTNSITVYVGSTESLTATVLPENATNPAVTWTIQNASPAGCLTVSNGTITGVAVGSATIVATAGEKQATCNVTISSMPVSSISLNKNSTTISAGGTETLTVTITPSNASDKTVTWSSSNNSIATVNANGVVTGVAPGTATITVRSHYDSNISASCTVTVTKVAVTSITLSPTSMTLYVGGDTGTITATVNPENATYKTITWSSDKSNIATVNENTGVVTPVAVGTATITATADGVFASCSVTVSESEPEWVKVTDPATFSAGDELIFCHETSGTIDAELTSIASGNNGTVISDGELTAACVLTLETGTASNSYSFKNGSNYISWSSGNNMASSNTKNDASSWTISSSAGGDFKFANVGTSGRILQYNANNGNPKWAPYSNNGQSAFQIYRLENGSSGGGGDTPATISVTGVELNKSATSLTVGEQETLTATVLPEDATNKAVNWSSSNENVATVENGVVEAIAAGEAVITVTTVDQNMKDTCTVTVTASGGSSGEETTTYTFTDKYWSANPADWDSGKDGYGFNNGGVQVTSAYSGANATSPVSFDAVQSVTVSYCTNSSSGAGSITVEVGSYEIGTTSVTTTGGTSARDMTFTTDGTHSGNITITVTCTTNSIYICGCSITTGEPEPVEATDLSIPASATASIGSPKTLDVTYTPSNANTGLDVIWSSSDTTKAEINQSSGLITPKAAGETVITAMLSSDHSKTAHCTLTVTEQALDKWTIFMYVSGNDLESGGEDGVSYGGQATNDLNEIKSVKNQPSDVNIVVQAGGANAWLQNQNGCIDSSKLNRFHLRNKQYVKDEQISYASMGSASTLQSYLEWGIENYPAEKYGLIFWNHGGGMYGVCLDEKASDDPLVHNEVKQAVSSAFNNKGISKFEFVGYDACLMQMMEIAEFNSEYFNYQVGSQELENGTGWDYDTWVDDLYAYKSSETIFKAMCDGFITDNGGVNGTGGNYQGTYYPADQTLSYLKLSYMSTFKTAWENMASALYDKITNSNKGTFKSSILENTKYFDSIYNDWKTYAEFDCYNFIERLENNSTFNPGSTYTSAVKTAINNLVGYSCVQKEAASDAHGVSFYFGSARNSSTYTSFANWRNVVSRVGGYS